jgi:hypothetical protein
MPSVTSEMLCEFFSYLIYSSKVMDKSHGVPTGTVPMGTVLFGWFCQWAAKGANGDGSLWLVLPMGSQWGRFSLAGFVLT